MARTKKPNTFKKKKNLDGTEEVYSQAGGVNRKFTTTQLKEWLEDVLDIEMVIFTGGTVYDTAEHLSGEQWIDSKPIYRQVIDVPQFTTGGDESGDITLGAGNYIDHLVSMDVAVEFTNGGVANKTTYPLNYLGVGAQGIDGQFRVAYDGTTSTKLFWSDVWDSGDVSTSLPKFTVIIRYTKV